MKFILFKKINKLLYLWIFDNPNIEFSLELYITREYQVFIYNVVYGKIFYFDLLEMSQYELIALVVQLMR